MMQTDTEQNQPMEDIPRDKPILLFDGVCNLCQGSVQFIVQRDEAAKIRLASLQSEVGQQLLEAFGLDTEQFNSLILIEGDQHYTQSTAALRVARRLDGLWSWLYAFIIVPKPLRDLVYDLIARNRYRWFGKDDQCMLPTPDLKARFLE